MDDTLAVWNYGEQDFNLFLAHINYIQPNMQYTMGEKEGFLGAGHEERSSRFGWQSFREINTYGSLPAFMSPVMLVDPWRYMNSNFFNSGAQKTAADEQTENARAFLKKILQKSFQEFQNDRVLIIIKLTPVVLDPGPILIYFIYVCVDMYMCMC